ncbi:MAG: hypothetical protein EBR90_02265 [Actinobacteria bacterium]|nr:hypothetical protein [Actinomycetota bacterium]
MSEPKFDADFMPYIIAKQVELELLAAYVGKDESQKILISVLQEIGNISPPIVTDSAAIKDPHDYIILTGKLVEKRKALSNHRKTLDNTLKTKLSALEAKLGESQVNDRLNNWLARYNNQTQSQSQTVYQVMNIATIEKLITNLNSLL